MKVTTALPCADSYLQKEIGGGGNGSGGSGCGSGGGGDIGSSRGLFPGSSSGRGGRGSEGGGGIGEGANRSGDVKIMDGLLSTSRTCTSETRWGVLGTEQIHSEDSPRCLTISNSRHSRRCAP